jgi:hypothetical protein
MKNNFLLFSNEVAQEGNIYADKSALILDWLLRKGLDKEKITLREVANDVEVSIGLVQRVFKLLMLKGLLQVEGVRTAKKFFFKKPDLLLQDWVEHYSIVEKCRMWTYRSGFSEKTKIHQTLKKSNLSSKIALALHSAVNEYNCKNTNLDTVELYLLDPAVRPKVERILQLEPQEKGYEVLLIEPYYKSLLNLEKKIGKNIRISSPFLTFLDLYHFPLRGREQAEFMIRRIPELKHIYKKG